MTATRFTVDVRWSRRGRSIELIDSAFGVPNNTIESAVA